MGTYFTLPDPGLIVPIIPNNEHMRCLKWKKIIVYNISDRKKRIDRDILINRAYTFFTLNEYWISFGKIARLHKKLYIIILAWQRHHQNCQL